MNEVSQTNRMQRKACEEGLQCIPGDEQRSARIPKRIIQTWKSSELPLLYRASMANARLLNPEFEYMFFDDEAVEAFIRSTFPEYKDVFYAFKYPIQRADFFRYLAVFHYGGFYLDMDVLLVSELTKLLQHECVFSFEGLTFNRFLREEHGLDFEIGNYAFGAEAGNPFLAAVIKNCVRAQTDRQWVNAMMKKIPRMFHQDFYILNTTGPGLVSRTLAENPTAAEGLAMLFPEDMRDKRKWNSFGEFGVHLSHHSWRNNPNFFYRWSFAMWMRWSRRRLCKAGPRTWRIGRCIMPGLGR